MEKEDDYTASFSPSFSSYANDGLVETAERVRLECSGEYNNNDDDDGFEFVNIRSDYEAEASFSGDCDLVFPVFNQAVISKPSAVKSDESSRPAVTTRLRDLFRRDREDSSSSSSDEEKELEGVSSEMYCPWTPGKSSNGGWRKSKSTGSSSSSRRWRIRDLLKRSYSEGKQSLSFLNSNSRNRVDEASKKEKVSSAHEKFYLKKKAKKEEEKRKSYLPYKQFGLFFFNVHHR
ncbi:hypothetical protein IGI04_015566 [Brassica rapa subsp. trilocularis]|uniref:Uncharacterized protein n=1 Tax=Brassica rapa subsp. trilocularis TaxID=1813537 RepID=A0ABQ7MQG1_BRACM|nr:hypothetical protein IGI04_015566 [Brassica rapa subsp. trilocularis]